MQTNEWISLLVATLCVAYVGIRIANTKERLTTFRQTIRRDQVTFQTGDLLLFHSNLLLMFLLNSPFSHVGVVVVLNHTPYVFEIVPHNRFPTLTPVNRLNLDKGVYHRSIETPLDTDKVVKYIEMEGDRMYDFALWYPLVKQTFDHVVFPRLPHRTRSCLSCATLVGKLLHRFGVMVHQEHFVPEDFSSLRHEGRWQVEKKLI